MSRVGKKPIDIPEGVTASTSAGAILIKGPKGELSLRFPPDIKAEIGGGKIIVFPAREGKKISAVWGLTRSLVSNLVEGVSRGYEKKLEFEGIGYRAAVEGGVLTLQLGFSHPVKIKAPEGIEFLVAKNVITVSGADKEAVGRTASRIRSLKAPEPYKGKGIRYQGELIKRKAGKKTAASAQS